MTPKRMRRARQFECLENRCYLSSVGWDGPGRGSAELTYYIGKAPSYLGQARAEAAIERALSTWSDVVDITFTQTPTAGRRDSIDFTFGRIDGSGGTLAQAYLPDDVNSARIAGDVQFDTSETWEVGNGQGTRAFDLLLVAVHEIGHALGLEHSRGVGSVMGSSGVAKSGVHKTCRGRRRCGAVVVRSGGQARHDRGHDPNHADIIRGNDHSADHSRRHGQQPAQWAHGPALAASLRTAATVPSLLGFFAIHVSVGQHDHLREYQPRGDDVEYPDRVVSLDIPESHVV